MVLLKTNNMSSLWQIQDGKNIEIQLVLEKVKVLSSWSVTH